VFALLVAVLAWPAVLVLHDAGARGSIVSGLRGMAVMGGMSDAHGGHAGHGTGSSIVAGPTTLASGELLEWVVMVTAMMVPLVWPAIRHVGLNSLRWRRQRAIAVFLSVYVAVWTVFGAVVLGARGLLTVGAPAVPAALAVAALWQLTPLQRRFRRACHHTVALPPRGLRAVAGDVRFGLRQGVACIGVCWPLMVAMALAPGAIVLWMVLLSAAMACAKLLPRSYRLSGLLAACLGGAAAVALVMTLG
jgi:predicted metal-binding membrane protein